MNKIALTLKEAADAIGVSEPTMRELANKPGFPAIRVGNRWVIPTAAFTAWLNEQGRAGARY